MRRDEDDDVGLEIAIDDRQEFGSAFFFHQRFSRKCNEVLAQDGRRKVRSMAAEAFRAFSRCLK
jgi:hypothetical protein